MTEQSLWRFSRAFQRALNERQTDQLESILDENVDWAIYGPIDMFAETRLQNVYTKQRGVIDTKAIRAFPVTFGFSI